MLDAVVRQPLDLGLEPLFDRRFQDEYLRQRREPDTPSVFEVWPLYGYSHKGWLSIMPHAGVYDNDLGEPIADGFYFSISFPGFDDGVELLRELLHYGISAITLETAGSCRTEGLRACVSMVGDQQYPALEWQLKKFRQDHPA